MQSSIRPKCINAHFAQKICLQQDCCQPALICDKKDPSCQNHHKDCSITVSVDGAISKLFRQGKLSQSIDDEIIKCYDDIIKIANVQKDEYLKFMQKPQYRLKNEQRQLLKLLAQGPSSLIFPKFVHDTLKSTFKLSGTKWFQQKNKILLQLENCVQQIRRLLLNIKLIGGKGVIDYTFSDDLNNHNCFELENLNKIIKTKNQSTTCCRFALIVPYLQQKSDIKQKVKIFIKKNIGTFFGVYCLKAIQNSQYQSIFYDKLGHGAFMTDNTGWIYNSNLIQQNMVRSNKMQYVSGDTIQMQYLCEQKKLKITNALKNKQLFLDIKFPKDDKLYFCLGTSFNKDEYNIIR